MINPDGHSKISAKRNSPDFECQTLPCSNGRLPAPCLHERPRIAKDPAETADDPRYGAAGQLLPPNRRCGPPIPLALLLPTNAFSRLAIIGHCNMIKRLAFKSKDTAYPKPLEKTLCLMRKVKLLNLQTGMQAQIFHTMEQAALIKDSSGSTRPGGLQHRLQHTVVQPSSH